MNFNELSKQIYAQNKEVGWWDDPNRCVLQTIQLVNTELAEATEGDRKNLMDDHLPHRKMLEVELADAAIRLLDLGGRYNLAWLHYVGIGTTTISKVAKNTASLLLDVTFSVCAFAEDYATTGDLSDYYYSVCLNKLVSIAEKTGSDLEGAIMEKLAYNKSRLDHKRENRSKEGGKAYQRLVLLKPMETILIPLYCRDRESFTYIT